jgi:hypothetical protein
MNFATFLVIDAETNTRSMRRSAKDYQYSEQGEIIYPLEVPIPIIKRRTGCIGIAVISELKITKTKTTIVFSITEIDKTAANAYYQLYRNTASMNQMSSDDVYSNAEDAIIPGAMGNNSNIQQPNKPQYGNNRSLAAEAGISTHNSFRGDRRHSAYDDND